MNDLKSLDQQTIESAKVTRKDRTSSLIMKFEEGGKVNFSAFPHGESGVAQLDIDLGGIKEEDLPGKRILSSVENFDGKEDSIHITFKDNTKMIISASNTLANATAGLKTNIYTGDNMSIEKPGLVGESVNYYLKENSYLQKGQSAMSNMQYESEDEDEVDLFSRYKEDKKNKKIKRKIK